MSQSCDLVLTGANVVNHGVDGVRDLAIADGRIAAIGQLPQSAAREVIDAQGSRYRRAILSPARGGAVRFLEALSVA